MKILKGLVATLATVIALAIFTIVYVSVQMRAEGVKAATGIVFREWIYSPLYWVLALVLAGSLFWLFRRWVLA